MSHPVTPDEAPAAATGDAPRRYTRRGVLAGTAGGAAAGALAVGAAGLAGGCPFPHHAAGTPSPSGAAERDAIDLTKSYPFYDTPHPPGVEEPQQRHLMYMALDLVPGATTRDLQSLLARWSAAIAQMMAGLPIGSVEPTRANGIGVDTGEAYGLDPASLTVTVGLGPGIFSDRFGLGAKAPSLLRPLPALPRDNLDPKLTGGDLSVQACADDPQVAYHAVRNLARMVRGVATTRWTVLGFGRASAGRGQETPRNLFGFKDGTRNLKEPGAFEQFVWAKDAGWMSGGTYQVVRKIRMNLEIWDADRVDDQQRIFGRTKDHGAPLSGAAEFDPPDFALKRDGKPVIDPTSHMALAAPENNDGIMILRRGYNYTDGLNAYGQLDAGLFFIAYVNDPEHFVRLQRKLGSADLMNEYIQHIGSAIFAVPPAPRKGRYIAQELFE